MSNLDRRTVEDFGREWSRFDQSAVDERELRAAFEGYFRGFPWQELPANAVGFDLGCGSGRWARFVSERVGTLHCIDPSAEALSVARKNLSDRANCVFHQASVDEIPLPDGSADFGYSLGVLHHVPDTAAGLRACVAKLKTGAPFRLYLYYALENRPLWFRFLWRCSDLARRVTARLPAFVKTRLADVIAVTVYWPLSRLAGVLERLRMLPKSFPLSQYRHSGFYTLRTDALDRFGTRIEKRFTAEEIRGMMDAAGLERVTIDGPPYWCAVGYKRADPTRSYNAS
ncbi:MAG: class I SAM-dependent methyltransferase [Thermoanaerobaculia bacterium]